MFRFAPKGIVFWPVTVPTSDDGVLGEATIFIQYRVFTRSELKARAAKLTNATVEKISKPAPVAADAAAQLSAKATELKALVKETDAMQKQNDAELLDRIVGWRDLVDEAGESLPFTKENLKAVLDVEALHGPIERGLNEASRGAKAKN